jgi:hypothetical protein
MIGLGLAAIFGAGTERQETVPDAPIRCLRCHRPLRPDAKRPAVRGIGRDCWKLMQRAKDADPECKTLIGGPDVVLVWDGKGRLHHNVSAHHFPPGSTPGTEADPVGLRLAVAILRSTGVVRPEWLPHLSPVFYDDFLRGMDADSAIIKGADIRAWIMEHTNRGDQ